MKYGVACLFLIVIAIGFTQAGEKECQPGETKQEDCNTCTCTSTGIYACTRKYCLHKRAAPECQPGETKQVDCNTCNCYNGVFGCTRKLCVTKREAISARFNTQLTREKRDVPLFADLETTPCAPNDYFQIDCNTCYCNTDRTGYLCTENICQDSNFDLSTTSQIPLTNDTMLIVSNQGVQLLKNLNTNDNSISRIADSLTDTEDDARNFTKKRL